LKADAEPQPTKRELTNHPDSPHFAVPEIPSVARGSAGYSEKRNKPNVRVGLEKSHGGLILP